MNTYKVSSDSLVSRTFPDRRIAPAVDVFAGDRRKMENALTVAFVAQSRRQYLEIPEQLTCMGAL